jgi:hypothetical protein
MREAEALRHEFNLALYCVDALRPFSELLKENSGLKFFPAMKSFFQRESQEFDQPIRFSVCRWLDIERLISV